MIAVIVAALNTDAALIAALPGGIYDAGAVGVIGRQSTPGAFDANGELRPCALIQARTAIPAGGRIDARLTTLAVYLYQREGTGAAAIDAGLVRIRALLHRTRLTPPTGIGAWELAHGDDALGRYDPSLRATMHVSTYLIPTRS